MNDMNKYINEIEPQYKENLHKVATGTWTLQQWYEYCTVVLGDLMNIHDKKTEIA